MGLPQPTARLTRSQRLLSTLLSDDFKDQYDDIDFRVLENLRGASYNEEMEITHTPVYHIITKDLPYIREQIMDIKTKLEEQMDIEGGNTI